MSEDLPPAGRLGSLTGGFQKALTGRPNFGSVCKALVGDVQLTCLGIPESHPCAHSIVGRQRRAGHAKLPIIGD